MVESRHWTCFLGEFVERALAGYQVAHRFEVCFQHGSQGAFVERGGGMVEREDRIRVLVDVDLFGLAVEFGHAGDGFHVVDVEFCEDEFGGEVAECGDDFGFDYLDLFDQVGRVRADLVVCWVSVVWRAVFEDVGDVDVVKR